MSTTVPELIDIETLANRLGDSVRHVRRLVAESRIPYLKVGHFVRFDPAEIVRWLDNTRQPDRTGGGATGEHSPMAASRRRG